MRTWKYDIYLGCKDQDSHREDLTLQMVEEKVAGLFAQMQVGFSVTRQLGGYIHADGTYICEESILVTLLGMLEEEKIHQMVRAFKKERNQESVLVVRTAPEQTYLTARGEDHEEI